MSVATGKPSQRQLTRRSSPPADSRGPPYSSPPPARPRPPSASAMAATSCLL
eukprot:CAMPEP_0177729352 /NCGR_PEP_ID=MMETSP0484_2-20121128/21384_1 /TAXON_ID=354590 /ORGANISM="Rhodomonas lens, Strain RHODO" /LENGTH=51 /DNA_ID=CAMNT_0019242217 /DNA_START=76 /DNA_END=227 /DNA_ORIENTATION=-